MSASKIYDNWLALDGSPRDLVNVLRDHAHVSLDSGLCECGISTQSPRTLTCVTIERPKEVKARTITISCRSISPRLFWVFVRKTTRYGGHLIAEPEKAILDRIYLGTQNGAAPALDELDFGSVDRPKLELCAQISVIHLSTRATGFSRNCGAGAGA
jgi:hypothetical protein